MRDLANDCVNNVKSAFDCSSAAELDVAERVELYTEPYAQAFGTSRDSGAPEAEGAEAAAGGAASGAPPFG